MLKIHQIHTVVASIGHKFEHHNALADEEAVGWILLALIAENLCYRNSIRWHLSECDGGGLYGVVTGR